MSVYTDADKSRDEIRQHIKEIIRNSANILVDECWGSDEYRDDYLSMLREFMHLMLEYKAKI